jgi:glucosamine 6-phosphate synthetase-like amidotransferase/phosphosugar isomerase protein
MCGVFGFQSKDGSPVNLSVLRAIALATAIRGKHAWGLAWIDGQGRMNCFKQTGDIRCSLGLLEMAAEARTLIGHCRFATQGSPDDNLNNHPHPCDGGWIVHNGQIPNYRQLIKGHRLHPVTDCDSEVIGLLIERAEGSLLDRMTEAVSYVPDRSPLVVLGIWKPGTLVWARSGNPLCMGRTKQGMYLASLPWNLPGKIEGVPENEIYELKKGGRYVAA